MKFGLLAIWGWGCDMNSGDHVRLVLQLSQIGVCLVIILISSPREFITEHKGNMHAKGNPDGCPNPGCSCGWMVL